jgi:predicted RNase H-like nuclease (RuvC/YqgF family)
MKSLNFYYVKQKENELKKLEEKKAKLSREIVQETSELENSKENLEKLKLENNMLKEQYGNLKKLIKSRGIILDIENNRYNIKEWDNLYIKRKTSRFFILSRNEEEIYSLGNATCMLMEDMFSAGCSCSIVVIRVTAKWLKLQIRFIKKEA